MMLFKVEPDAAEGCISWVLRTAQANLLDSPWHLFRLAGINPAGLGPLRFDLRKLSAFSGITTEALGAIACTNHHGRDARVTFRGQRIPTKQIRNLNPKVCPMCIHELGIARAAWDLNLVDCCSVHCIQLASRCAECGRGLRWFRPAVSRCRCGADLRLLSCPPATPASIAVAQVVEAAAFGAHPRHDSPGEDAARAFSSTSLPRVFKIFQEIARLAGAGDTLVQCEQHLHVEAVGQVLINWPEGVHAVMRTWASTQGKLCAPNGEAAMQHEVPGAAYTLINRERLRFRKRTGTKNLQSDVLDLEFMRFLASAAVQSVDPRTRKQMIQAGVDPQLVTISDAAKRLGVHYRSVESMINQGRISTIHGWNGATPAQLIPLTQLTPTLGRVKLLECRAAVELTGLPRHVLTELRATGDMEHSNKGIRVNSFAEADIVDLIDRWRKLPMRRIPPKAPTTSFQEVLRRGNEPYRTAWKAELVRRILQGRIAVSARSATPLEAILRVEDVLVVRQEFAKEVLSLGDAATALAIPTQSVLELVALGGLAASVLRDKVRIQVRDVHTFSASFTRLGSLRKWREEELLHLCEQNGIPIVDVAGRGERCRFIQRAHVAPLIALATSGASTRSSGTAVGREQTL